MAGRHRKTTVQKELDGTSRKDRRNPAEPRYEAAIPPAPTWLSKEGLAEWKRLTPELHAQRLLAKVDMAVLAAYCELLAELADLTRRLASGERFMVDDSVQKYPLAKERREAIARLQSLASELGLSPASRSKVSPIPEGDSEDPLQRLMRKKTAVAQMGPERRPN